MSFQLFTDSSANLTNEIIDRYEINIVSLLFISQGKEYISYQKNADNDLKKFYTMLRNKEHLSTSCINDETFTTVFEEALIQGKDVLYIGFSSALSGTFYSAEQSINKLKVKYPERKVLCSNTLGASLGQGLLVLYAARMRSQGKNIDEVFQWQEENKLKLCHYFTVDDLYYLFKGGRVKATKYLIANIVNLKPIMHMDDFGRLMPISKVIGRRKSLSVLADMVIKNIVEPEKQTLCITHGDCIEDAEFLMSKVSKEIKVNEWIVNYVDPVVGAHSGPGTVAIFFMGAKR